jgi:hypothetical protein
MSGHGEKMTRKQEQAIAALLSEATVTQAAIKAGVSHATLRRWLKESGFVSAYRQARREVVESAIGRIQAATGTAVDTLLTVAKSGAKDGDRVRAAVALLEHAVKGFDLPTHAEDRQDRPIGGTSDVVTVLAERLRQLDAADLSTGEKSRLTVALGDALLRAIGVNLLDKRLEALQAVLNGRKDQEHR